MVRRSALVLVLLLVLPVALGAADFYVGAGLGSAIEGGRFSQPLAEFGVRAEDDSRKIYGGAELGEHLAVEATYYDFGSRICCPRLADAGFETELDGLGLALIGRLPLARLEPFAKAGVLFWQEDGQEISIVGPRPLSADGSDPVLGLGVSWRVLEALSLVAEWETFELAGDSGDAVWVTLRLHF